jgi:O-succinylbenzoic acid--CoA ligase
MMNSWTPEFARRWIVACAPALLESFDDTAESIADRPRPAVALSDPDNAVYAGALVAALAHGVSAVCFNPKWTEAQREEAAAALKPENFESAPCVLVPTGGTGGKIRFVRHTPATLAAAVSGFSSYAGERLLRSRRPAKLHAVQALPCCHVSGLMPVIRAWLTGGELVFASPSFRAEDALPPMPATADGLTVVSLVNAQLHRLLDRLDGPSWLREAGLVLVGGSSIAPELLDRARAEKIPLGVSYGLTECAALAALYPPDAFLRGEPVAGEVLPHLRAEITSQGRIALSGASVSREVIDADGRYVTGDEGFFDEQGRLVVTGRADRIIVSGGEKIDPAEIETAIRATGLVREVIVIGEPDLEWGRRLVAVYCGDISPESLADACAGVLAGHRRPRRWVRSAESLFDEKGKIRTALLSQSLGRSF